MTLIFSGTAGLFLIWAFYALWHIRWVRRLPALESLRTAPTEGRIECSVVIAARDEEARIEQTIRHLLAQRGVEAEFIVVNDRSTDSTNEILQRLAKEDARVQVKLVDVLPDGWLGKCHACHVGASAATGDWMLFTDAGWWLKPDVRARALSVAKREEADHITIASAMCWNRRSKLRASGGMALPLFAIWSQKVSGQHRTTAGRPRRAVARAVAAGEPRAGDSPGQIV